MAASSNPSLEFGELSGNEILKERIESFQGSLKNVEQLLDTILANDVYDSLSPEDKVRYDLFLSFTINSLYWFYLRTQGIDPNQHDLKNEITRVKEYMAKSKKIYERKHVMPRIDQGAAERFIKHGLWNKGEINKEPISEFSTTGKRKREESNSD